MKKQKALSETTMGPLSLSSLLKEVVKLLRATMPSNYEIRLNLSKDASPVHANATQLHQVIMNLSTNAYHAMKAMNTGILTLALDTVDEQAIIHCHGHDLPAGRYVRLRISDTGEGICPENLDKIFDPYFTTKKQGEGTGLGLSVSLGIITSHQGGIQVDSRRDGGTLFYPLSACQSRASRGTG